MGANNINGDLAVQGNLSCGTFSAPASCIMDAAVATPAGGAAGVGSSKLNHRQHARYSQGNVTIVTETRPIWITYGTAGTLKALRAGLIGVNIGGATVAIDLYKNGASVLTAPITLNSGTAARTPAAATISNTATAAGDWFDAVITATVGGGTLGTGLYVELVVDENPS